MFKVRGLRVGFPRGWQVGLCLFVIIPALAHPALRSRLALSVGLESAYDRNVFLFSPHDESTFLYHRNDQPGRFPYRSLDDMVLALSGRLRWTPRLLRRHTTQVDLNLRGNQYLSNPIKSYLSGSLRFRQYFSRSFHLEAGYLVIPYYLIRYYRDPSDPSTYRPCSFAEHLLDLSAVVSLGPRVSALPFLRYEIDDYAAPFVFYNTTALRGGAGFEVTPVKWLLLGANYEFKSARAQGPTPDISYLQHALGLAFKTRFSRFRPGLGYDYTWRGFTTVKDSTHLGRVDVTRGAELALDLALGGSYGLEGRIRYEWRKSSAPLNPDIDEVKDYSTVQAGIGIRYGGTR